MKRTLSACKIYNECPNIIFSFFPWLLFLSQRGFVARMSLGLILLVDFLQTSCTNWVIEIISKWDICSDAFGQQQQQSQPSSYFVVKHSMCDSQNALKRLKKQPKTKKLMFKFRRLDKENGAFVWVSLIISPANGCSCVNNVWMCVCVRLFSVLFTEPHFEQLPPWTILTTSSHKRTQSCPLDSQIVWQHLALTFDPLGKVWVDCGNTVKRTAGRRGGRKGRR